MTEITEEPGKAAKSGRVGWIVAIILSAMVGCSIGKATNGSQDSTPENGSQSAQTLTVTATEAAEEAVVAEPEQPSPTFGDGMRLVGSQIQPGTYSAEGGKLCYWARLSGTSGELSDIITNNLGGGAQIVTIDSADVAFESRGCGEWSLA